MKAGLPFIIADIITDSISSYKEYKVEELRNQTQRQISRDQKERDIAYIHAMTDAYIRQSDNQLKKDLAGLSMLSHFGQISLQNNDHQALEMILNKAVEVITNDNGKTNTQLPWGKTDSLLLGEWRG
jgi:hypothetical protein